MEKKARVSMQLFFNSGGTWLKKNITLAAGRVDVGECAFKEAPWHFGGRQCPAHRCCRISLAYLQGVFFMFLFPHDLSQQRGIVCSKKLAKYKCAIML